MFLNSVINGNGTFNRKRIIIAKPTKIIPDQLEIITMKATTNLTNIEQKEPKNYNWLNRKPEV